MKKGFIAIIVGLSALVSACGVTDASTSDTDKGGVEVVAEGTGSDNADDVQHDITDSSISMGTEVGPTATPVPTIEATPSQEPVQVEDPAEEQDISAVENIMDTEVDKGMLTVTINIPKDMVSTKTQEELDKKVAEEEGYISAILNADGSATYVMTKAKHNEMMVSIKGLLEEELSKIPGSEKTPNITSVTMNANADVFTVVTTSETLTIDEKMEALVFYGLGGLYNQMNGTSVDNIRVDYINAATGQIIDTANSKNMR